MGRPDLTVLAGYTGASMDKTPMGDMVPSGAAEGRQMAQLPGAVRGARRLDAIPFSDIRRVLERATQLERAGKKILHFEIGRPDFDTPAPIKAAAIKALADGQVQYSSHYSIPALRAAIAANLERDRGLHYRRDDEIIETLGANEAVGAAFMPLIDPGSEMLV